MTLRVVIRAWVIGTDCSRLIPALRTRMFTRRANSTVPAIRGVHWYAGRVKTAVWAG
jgi:hypothetical protein